MFWEKYEHKIRLWTITVFTVEANHTVNKNENFWEK